MTYSIFQADLQNDKDNILSFWRDNQTDTLDQKYKWIYEDNPAGKANVWLVNLDESGECVGMVSLFHRRFSGSKQSFSAGIAGDYLVNKKHRVLKPALMLQKSIISAVHDGMVDFIYAFPNEAAEAIVKRTGYKLIGSKTRLVKFIKTEPILLKWGLPKMLISLLSPILNFALRFTSVETWFRGSNDFVCEEINEFDERFDQLWEAEKSKFTISGERTAEHLKWRFQGLPHDANKIFAAFDSQKSVLKGYIVYRHQDNAVEIRDLFFASDEKASFTLMNRFLRHVRPLAPDSIEITLLKNNYVDERMRRFGFLKRKSSKNIYLYCFQEVWKDLTLSGEPHNFLLMESDDDT